MLLSTKGAIQCYIFSKGNRREEDVPSILKSKHMRSKEPRSSSSCAACKFLKRRCTPHCLLAPYFRANESNKFAKVHKVFGASNVAKILNEVPEPQRQDAVNSLVFEADERLRDPVHGCIGAIVSLQGKMVQLQHDLAVARARLARCSTEPSLPFLISDGELGMAAFDDFLVCNGMVGSFSQNSLDQLGQGGSTNQP